MKSCMQSKYTLPRTPTIFLIIETCVILSNFSALDDIQEEPPKFGAYTFFTQFSLSMYLF